MHSKSQTHSSIWNPQLQFHLPSINPPSIHSTPQSLSHTPQNKHQRIRLHLLIMLHHPQPIISPSFLSSHYRSQSPSIVTYNSLSHQCNRIASYSLPSLHLKCNTLQSLADQNPVLLTPFLAATISESAPLNGRFHSIATESPVFHAVSDAGTLIDGWIWKLPLSKYRSGVER